MEMIDLSIYLAKYKQLQQKGLLYRGVRYEIITRVANHVLSPSWKLLNTAKAEKWSFEKYAVEFKKEIQQNPAAQAKLRELAVCAFNAKCKIYLICYEKDATKCHRSLVKQMIIDKTVRCWDCMWREYGFDDNGNTGSYFFCNYNDDAGSDMTETQAKERHLCENFAEMT